MLESYDFSPYHAHVLASRDLVSDVTSPHARVVESAHSFLETASLRNLLDICQENILGLGALSVLEIGGVSFFKKFVILILFIINWFEPNLHT